MKRVETVLKIPDSELEVLQALYELQRATAREVHQQLQDEGKTWSYSTVNTLLGRLEQKKLVSCDKAGVAFIYRPLVSRQDVVQKRVRRLVDQLYAGEAGSLIVHLLKSHQLSSSERSTIRKLLDQVAGESERTGRSD